MKIAVGYIRVSTLHQAETGSGLIAQQQAISAFAAHEGYELLDIKQDVVSAKAAMSISRRPGLREALALAKQSNAVILVWDISRLSRDARGFADFMSNQFQDFIDIREASVSARASLAAKVERAQIEAEHLAERTLRGMRRAKKRGVVFGNPANLEEARRKGVVENVRRAEEYLNKIAKDIERLRAAGFHSMDALVEALNNEEILTPYGKSWTKNNIRHTLKRIEKRDGSNLSSGSYCQEDIARLSDEL